MSDTPEHTRIVDGACKLYFGRVIKVKVGGASFTLGEISALAADFYATPAALREDAARARSRLHEYQVLNFIYLTPDPDNDGTRSDPGKYDKFSIWHAIAFQGNTFIELAIKNQAHFVHGDPSSRKWCIDYHGAAVELGKHIENKADDPWHEKSIEANDPWHAMMLHEGFALHFLVDMFAAGHMRTPRAAIERYLHAGKRLEVNPVDVAKQRMRDAEKVAALSAVNPLLPILGAWPKQGEKDQSKKAPGYAPDNANIIGALLSLAQHDHDNYTGLPCAWRGPVGVDGVDPRPARMADKAQLAEYRTDPSGLFAHATMPYQGMYTGDDFFHSLEQVERSAEQHGTPDDSDAPATIPEPGSKDDHAKERKGDDGLPRPNALNPKKHLFGAIAAHVLHAWPGAVAPAVAAPWPGEGQMSEEAFLAYAAPVPVEKAQTGGWMRASVEGGEEIVRWYGPEVVYPFSWAKLTVSTHEDRSINCVTLEIPYLEYAAVMAFGAASILPTGPSVYNEIVGYAVPLDGNDPKVPALFKDAKLVTWLAEHAVDGAEAIAEMELELLRTEVALGMAVEESVRKELQREADLLKKGIHDLWEGSKALGEKVGKGVKDGIDTMHRAIDTFEQKGGRFLEQIEREAQDLGLDPVGGEMGGGGASGGW